MKPGKVYIVGAEPVALIRWGTTEKQETLTGTLANITHKAYATKMEPSVVAVIGNVVTLSEQLHWFAESPPRLNHCCSH